MNSNIIKSNKVGNVAMTVIIVVFTISPVITNYCCNSVV